MPGLYGRRQLWRRNFGLAVWLLIVWNLSEIIVGLMHGAALRQSYGGHYWRYFLAPAAIAIFELLFWFLFFMNQRPGSRAVAALMGGFLLIKPVIALAGRTGSSSNPPLVFAVLFYGYVIGSHLAYALARPEEKRNVRHQGWLTREMQVSLSLDQCLSAWPKAQFGLRLLFLDLTKTTRLLPGVSTSVVFHPGISFSFRASAAGGDVDRSRPYLFVIDVFYAKDAPWFMSICFHEDEITDPAGRGQVIPHALSGGDARCFEVEEAETDTLDYLKERLREAWRAGAAASGAAPEDGHEHNAGSP